MVGTACMQKRSWCRRLMEAALRTVQAAAMVCMCMWRYVHMHLQALQASQALVTKVPIRGACHGSDAAGSA